MDRFNISDSGARGWFIGNFPEAVFKTEDFEVCYQVNERTYTESHYHSEVTEITLVIRGKVLLNGQIFLPGEIHVLHPGEISQLEYLEPSEVVTIKTPSRPEDKHLL